ncbi:NADPH-dependent oxidoreductase [Cryobacterium adonitolivorans]|uniref:NADPH-dependent oxidoreductase n=1 Tax=Cryobacterium adonitolivorans TaxID=1259189 RepID=A0A4R8W3I2_9MICO|nr:NAD(P)H-dependent oxidoreductase [Cryobacterium adonitolivorans]TFC01031.1 NADPH-dependent oxidoreductase [Cryobacterium adonitolivorans]
MDIIVLVASVHPGRVRLPIGQWVKDRVAADTRFDVDFVDLAALNLPMMNEPNHPRLAQYALPNTPAWSARVTLADAFLFVTPESNHSYAPSLKNAIDYLYAEWHGKRAGFVSYGGGSGGTRGVRAMDAVLHAIGLTQSPLTLAIPNVRSRVRNNQFSASSGEQQHLGTMLDDLTVG